MKTITVLLLALTLAACGGGSGGNSTAEDVRVQEILAGYSELGVSEAEVEQMAVDIDAALETIDNPNDRAVYLDTLQDQIDDSLKATEDYRP